VLIIKWSNRYEILFADQNTTFENFSSTLYMIVIKKRIFLGENCSVFELHNLVTVLVSVHLYLTFKGSLVKWIWL
jgi:hypothetical protein